MLEGPGIASADALLPSLVVFGTVVAHVDGRAVVIEGHRIGESAVDVEGLQQGKRQPAAWCPCRF